MTVCFLKDREISLDEEYLQMKNHMEDTLEKSSEIIRYYDQSRSIQSKIGCIQRGCRIYDAFNQIMDEMPKQKLENRMIYYREIESILRAILLAQNLISEEDIPEENFAIDDLGNQEWTIALARMFNEHWNEQKRISSEYISELDEQKAKKEQAMKDESLNSSDIYDNSVHYQCHMNDNWKADDSK